MCNRKTYKTGFMAALLCAGLFLGSCKYKTDKMIGVVIEQLQPVLSASRSIKGNLTITNIENNEKINYYIINAESESGEQFTIISEKVEINGLGDSIIIYDSLEASRSYYFELKVIGNTGKFNLIQFGQNIIGDNRISLGGTISSYIEGRNRKSRHVFYASNLVDRYFVKRVDRSH